MNITNHLNISDDKQKHKESDILKSFVNGFTQHKKNICDRLKIGFIGFSNSGKSSIINSFFEKKVAGVSCQPNHTKGFSLYKINQNISIMDCPGIFEPNTNSSKLVLQNAIGLENIDDIQQLVKSILFKIDRKQILKNYKIESFSDLNDFLEQVAKNNRKLAYMDCTNHLLTCRMIIKDWHEGRLSFSEPTLLSPNYSSSANISFI